jgi:multidrug resistance efflux pump
MSALAPAEVAAARPMLVTAPMDGVVADVLLPPGAWVDKDTPVLRLVDTRLRGDFEVASRNVAVAEARYFKTVQAATASHKDMEELATFKAELDVAKAERAYAAELLSRTEIRASSPGLLIYSSRQDLVGKPVATGERLMEIGDPAMTEIRIDLPVSDAIALAPGGHVSLFLDGDPLTPVRGTIERTGYRPVLSAEHQLVYRVAASFDGGRTHRIGLRGVARVSGEKVALWFYLFRRPIAAVRQWFGL